MRTLLLIIIVNSLSFVTGANRVLAEDAKHDDHKAHAHDHKAHAHATHAGHENASRPKDLPAPLFRGLGNNVFPITTNSRLAQFYFDQGLMLAYGFNHAEAARSFRAAQKLDLDRAMAYWGEA